MNIRSKTVRGERYYNRFNLGFAGEEEYVYLADENRWKYAHNPFVDIERFKESNKHVNFKLVRIKSRSDPNRLAFQILAHSQSERGGVDRAHHEARKKELGLCGAKPRRKTKTVASKKEVRK